MEKLTITLAAIALLYAEVAYSQTNTHLGAYAGNFGSHNTSVGYRAGDKATGSYNAYFGSEAGKSNSTGFQNVSIGQSAGELLTSAYQNTFVGTFAGSRTNGIRNIFLGYGAGLYSPSGSNNLFLGFIAGSSSSGSNNIFIGNSAGGQASGNGNIFIGNQAGKYDYTTSDKLIIANQSVTPLIYGDFSTRGIAIGTKTLGGYTLYVNGDAFTTGIWVSSDKRFKQNKKVIEGALDRVARLSGVSYEYKKSQKNTSSARQFASGTQLGFIAQELQQVLPEAVREDGEGYLAVNYQAVIPVLVEAIKELSLEVGKLQSQLAENSEVSGFEGSALETFGTGSLGQNWPNPFNRSTTVSFVLPQDSRSATIIIFDLQGREVASYDRLSGTNELVIPSRALNPGLYHYSLVVDGQLIDTKKMILTK